MKDVSNKFILGAIGFFCIMIVLLALGWITTCGMYWLVTLCFGWEFSWLTGTGIFLILMLFKMTVKSVGKLLNKD